MSSLDEQLSGRLKQLEEANLLRRLRVAGSGPGRLIRVDGRELRNFSANDYLGLAGHPGLTTAAHKAVEAYGAGSGASRLLSGSLEIHHQLERAIAAWKKTPAALSFSSGYATTLGIIPALVGPGDVVILDKLVHASIADAARLSGAKLRIFAHNDLTDLESILEWSRSARGGGNVLIVSESVFSMDGDLAPLGELVSLKKEHGAWLMIDEAHACGLYGASGSGRIEQLGLGGEVEVQMGTLGKAVGSAGGFVAGSETLIRFLVNRARSFIFSTAPAPGQSAAALAGVELVQGPEGAERRARLEAHYEQLAQTFRRPLSPIVPIPVGLEERALLAAANLDQEGFYLPAIRFPTVAKGQARLRVSLSAAHTAEDIDQLLRALRKLQLVA